MANQCSESDISEAMQKLESQQNRQSDNDSTGADAAAASGVTLIE